ncbi:MAG: aldehyde dehydrogenase family protein, partial [Rhodobacterales bacterium]
MLDSKTDLKSLLKDPSLLAEQAYVDGKWIDSDSGATFEVTNPARGDVIARVADLSRAQVAQAIAVAETAQKEWVRHTGKERAIILRRWFDLMVENTDDLAVILTAEQGKP